MEPVTSTLRANAAPVAVAATGSLALLGTGIASGHGNWPVYAFMVAVGAGIVVAVHRRVRLSRTTIWGLVVFALGHLAGGLVAVGDGILYQVWLVDGLIRYDNVQHAVGFGFVGRAVWESLRPRIAPSPGDRALTVWIVVLGACGAGAINEIAEYLLTLVLEEHQVGGYDNTARDLIANLVGGLTIGWWTSRRHENARASPLPRRPRPADRDENVADR
ncbi:hypothetical protein [Egicoccus sp. AB-alg6-2]|uniref:hypothetical protein n=1 Tax=Egicoccus sp. AB-alg6-2 TaxID=3242692 RepID=UPI00359EE4AA